MSVDWAEFAVGISPFVPDTDAVLLQIMYVGVTFEEPQEFINDRLKMKFLGRKKGEAVF